MAHARKLDPHTSHEAANSVRNETRTQSVIMSILSFPMTDEELVKHYQALSDMDAEIVPRASQSGIRSRRHELALLGKVVPVGYKKTAAKRSAIVWSVA